VLRIQPGKEKGLQGPYGYFPGHIFPGVSPWIDLPGLIYLERFSWNDFPALKKLMRQG
jgi:hypothetical protein